MAADEEPARYLLKVPLIPLGVATALPILLTDIRDLWQQWEQRGPGAARPLDSWDRETAKLATNQILKDLNHYISLATERGQQVPAARWELLLLNLHRLKCKLDAQR